MTDIGWNEIEIHSERFDRMTLTSRIFFPWFMQQYNKLAVKIRIHNKFVRILRLNGIKNSKTKKMVERIVIKCIEYNSNVYAPRRHRPRCSQNLFIALKFIANNTINNNVFQHGTQWQTVYWLFFLLLQWIHFKHAHATLFLYTNADSLYNYNDD